MQNILAAVCRTPLLQHSCIHPQDRVFLVAAILWETFSFETRPPFGAGAKQKKKKKKIIFTVEGLMRTVSSC